MVIDQIPVIDSLAAEMKRLQELIAECEVRLTTQFAIPWLRNLARQGEQAIRENNLTACADFLKHMGELR